MAAGDAATAAGYDTVSGTTPANTIDTEINKTRDYIAAQKTVLTGTQSDIVTLTNIINTLTARVNKLEAGH